MPSLVDTIPTAHQGKRSVNPDGWVDVMIYPGYIAEPHHLLILYFFIPTLIP